MRNTYCNMCRGVWEGCEVQAKFKKFELRQADVSWIWYTTNRSGRNVGTT